ncbi:MAG: GTP cyclohydrolase II [Proteobacteria bacterium]|nr:GTP cyclohydrolase II [Pseudomonadota bacterium]
MLQRCYRCDTRRFVTGARAGQKEEWRAARDNVQKSHEGASHAHLNPPSEPFTNRAQFVAQARMPTEHGDFRLCIYQTGDDKEHLAVVCGDVAEGEGVLTRLHSECFTGDVLGSLRCDCGPQLQRALRMIAQAGRGVVVYLRQEGRGIGLVNKLRAYCLQDEGYDTVDANLHLGFAADSREYHTAALILRDLKVRSVDLITNNPRKIDGLADGDVVVRRRVALEVAPNAENLRYLGTKAARLDHLLTLGTPLD